MSSAGLPTTQLTAPDAVWEYHIIHINVGTFFLGTDIRPEALRTQLDAAGADGWELVNTIDINHYQGSTSALVFFFKRPYRPNRYVQSSG